MRSTAGQAVRAPSSGSDRAAFTRFYRQTYWQAYTFTRRRIDSDDAARDVVAEAYRVVWQKREVALERGVRCLCTLPGTCWPTIPSHARGPPSDRLALDGPVGRHEQWTDR